MSPDNDTVTAKHQNVQHQHLMCTLVLCLEKETHREGRKRETERVKGKERDGEKEDQKKSAANVAVVYYSFQTKHSHFPALRLLPPKPVVWCCVLLTAAPSLINGNQMPKGLLACFNVPPAGVFNFVQLLLLGWPGIRAGTEAQMLELRSPPADTEPSAAPSSVFGEDHRALLPFFTGVEAGGIYLAFSQC